MITTPTGLNPAAAKMNTYTLHVTSEIIAEADRRRASKIYMWASDCPLAIAGNLIFPGEIVTVSLDLFPREHWYLRHSAERIFLPLEACEFVYAWDSQREVAPADFVIYEVEIIDEVEAARPSKEVLDGI